MQVAKATRLGPYCPGQFWISRKVESTVGHDYRGTGGQCFPPLDRTLIDRVTESGQIGTARFVEGKVGDHRGRPQSGTTGIHVQPVQP